MGDWPSSLLGYAARNTGNAYVAVDTSDANTKGSWEVLIASTPYPGFLSIVFAPGSLADILFDIGFGGEGAETVLMEDVLSSASSTSQSDFATTFMIPILIPSGTRIAARCQGTASSRLVQIAAQIVSAPSFMYHGGYALEKTYGAAAADSGGTSIDPGGTINTKGSWVEIAASTDYVVRGLAIGIGGQYNTARSVAKFYVDIGLTASPDNAIVIADYFVLSHNTPDEIGPCISQIYPVSIPAGTKISARASCTINDATDRLFDLLIYCFT